MSDRVRQIADAVLYEGYILWSYRRSAMKNAQRWTFGGVYPRAWSEAGHPDDRSLMQAQVLVVGSPEVDVSVRFLHVDLRRADHEHLRLHQRAVVGVPGLAPRARVHAAERPALRVLHGRAPVRPQD